MMYALDLNERSLFILMDFLPNVCVSSKSMCFVPSLGSFSVFKYSSDDGNFRSIYVHTDLGGFFFLHINL